MTRGELVVIVGQGYVGLPLALAAAENGYIVIGYDINEDVVANLNNGISHVEDISAEKLKAAIASGNYKATDNPEDFSQASVVVIAVPTPLTEGDQPDLSLVEAAAKTLGKFLRVESLIINESTSFPGTLRKVIKPLVESNSSVHLNHHYGNSPERVDPGNAMWTIENTPRLYSGMTTEAKARTRAFYSKFCTNLIELSEPEVAEAAKLFENTFRLINISLVNELSIVLGKLDIDTREVLEAASTKPYGFMKFNPSVGIGGHCIPVDPTYLLDSARQVGLNFKMIEIANELNLNMPKHVSSRIKSDHDGDLADKQVLILGVAYKPNIGDIRETPVESLIDNLLQAGANVEWHDPLVENWKGGISVSLTNRYWDVVVVATAHDEFKDLDILNMGRYVFDCSGHFHGAIQL